MAATAGLARASSTRAPSPSRPGGRRNEHQIRADLELVPDLELLGEVIRRFEDATFVSMKTRCPPGNQGQLVVQTAGCLYKLETLCADLCDIVRSKRLAGRQLEDWEDED